MTRLLDAFGVVLTSLLRRDPTIYGPDCGDWIDDATMQWIMDQAVGDLQAAAKLLGLNDDVGNILRPLFEVGLPASRYVDELREVKARLGRMRSALVAFQARVVSRTLPRARLDNW